MRWMLIAAPLTILIDCICFVNFFSWQNQSVYEFQQRQLDLQVNYAVDAAAQEMLSDGTHIDTDYIDWGSMTVEPEVALRTYESILLRNLGWSDFDKNREDLVESSMPFFLVAGYDGYYVYCRQHDVSTVKEDKNGNTKEVFANAYNFHWTPKLPYSQTVGDKVYFYYLGTDKYGSVDLSTNKNIVMNSVRLDDPLNDGTGPASKEQAKAIIAKTLTNAINSALFIGMEGKTDASYYIPAEMSEWSNNNSIQSPSVMVYMSRSDGTVQYDTVTFGIGGSKIDDVNFVICYNVNGVKKYAWASDRDAITSYYNGGNNFVLEILNTPEQAAQSGYYFDYNYYHR